MIAGCGADYRLNWCIRIMEPLLSIKDTSKGKSSALWRLQVTIFWQPRLLIFRLRRLRVLLLVDLLRVGNYQSNFRPWKNIVKGIFGSGKGPRFLNQIDDLRLKYCIFWENSNITISGETVEKAPEINFEIFYGVILPLLI